MPHTVKATGNGGDGGEERVAHPDGQHGVFLPQCLADRNAVVVPVADAFAEPELEGATQQGGRGDTQLVSVVHGTVGNALGRYGNGDGQGHGP